MPTPDPSVLPAAVAATAALFTTNWTTFVTATVALLGIIVIPTIVIRGGLRTAGGGGELITDGSRCTLIGQGASGGGDTSVGHLWWAFVSAGTGAPVLISEIDACVYTVAASGADYTISTQNGSALTDSGVWTV